MESKALALWQLNLNKPYLVTTDGLIYEDEYDYLESINTEFYGIKDDIEDWENQMLEENTEWLTGLEILKSKTNEMKERR